MKDDNKSVIQSLTLQKKYSDNEQQFYKAIKNKKLHTKKIIKIENFNIFIIQEDNKDIQDVYVEGLKINKIDDLDVVLLDYKIIDVSEIKDSLNQNGYKIENIDKLFSVSILTSDNLRRYIYEEQLYLYTYYFKEEKNALAFIAILERILYARKHNKIISDEIDKFN